MNPRQLFFDLDGTLTDSRPGIVNGIRYALSVFGIEQPSDERLQSFIGPPTHDAFKTLFGTDDPELIARAVGVYRERYVETGMFENSVYAGIPQGLAALRADGFRLFVVTSKPEVFAERIIDHFELRPFFDHVYGSELSGERSDKGELIRHVLTRERIEPRDAYMFGDRMHDIRGAKQNAVRAAGVLWGYGSRRELAEAGAEALFSSMPELARDLTGASSGDIALK